MIISFWKNQRGSALLVALLIMGVLTAISIVLSILIFREARITRDLIDAGKAYYAAESGVEIALYNLKNSLPGWEPTETREGGWKSYQVEEDRVLGELRVNNRCNAYPCFDDDFDHSSAPAEAFYDVLDLNDSITIPLFVVKNGEEVPVGDFVVEFFTNFNPRTDLKIEGDDLNGWDVLRWKVFGIRTEEPTRTETISDFTAVKLIQDGVASENPGEPSSTNAETPSWFGSLRFGCSGLEGRYNDDINCLIYRGSTAGQEEYIASGDAELRADEESSSGIVGEVVEEGDALVRADIYDVVCWPWQAREYYLYEYFFGERILYSENIQDCFDINLFMDTHKLKYLSLTNLMNPAVFVDEIQSDLDRKEALSRIYYRVEFFEDQDSSGGFSTGNESVREFANITSKGYSGDNAQTINVKIKRDSFMPVFNFSLYSTYKGDSGFDHYYESDE